MTNIKLDVRQVAMLGVPDIKEIKVIQHSKIIIIV